MKHILAAVVLAVFSTVATANDIDKPKTKFVCKEVKDSKTGKFKKQCKQIKIHKKYEALARLESLFLAQLAGQGALYYATELVTSCILLTKNVLVVLTVKVLWVEF